jgi:hypothetical protein
MSTLEIFEMNENGAGWVSLENASQSTKTDLEWALINHKSAKIEVRRLDKPTIRTCSICELAHEGLYCFNCFTGYRVRVSKTKFAREIRLTPISCNKKFNRL